MVTLTLKKKPGAGADTPSSRNRPLRSSGMRQRPTLAEAQEQRARQAEELARRPAPSETPRWQDERRPGGRPGPRDARDSRDPRDPREARGGRDPREARRDPRQDPRHDARREPRREDPRHGDRRDPRALRPGRPGIEAPASPLRSVGNAERARQILERASRNPDTGRPQQRQDRPPVQRDPAARPLRSVANPQLARQMVEAAAAATAPARPEQDGERLSKRMTALGLASRREADEWIEAGWVSVNGEPAVLGQRVLPGDRIEVDERAHKEQARRVTILLNKPIGHVSGQAEDGYEPAVALIRPENQWAEDRSGLRWHPGHLRNLAPAGRLDIDSVGLLVLTQDGRVARQLIGDESEVEKEYLVRVEYTREGRLRDEDLALLNHGLSLDGKQLRPCKVSWQNEDQLRFVLREGRKRQIRRMCEAVGLKVVGLKRVRIGSVPLGHLPVGQWRYLRQDEYFA